MRKLITLNNKSMEFLKAPKNLRQGQVLINFLSFLETEKDYYARIDVSDRGRDIFYISDEKLNKYWKEFIDTLTNPK